MYKLTRIENDFKLIEENLQKDTFHSPGYSPPYFPPAAWRQCKSTEKKAWTDFIRAGQVEPGAVSTQIMESWNRCLKAEVEFAGGRCQDILSTLELEKRQSQLAELAWPLLKTLHQFVRGFGFVIVLIDHDGYILKSIGDLETLRQAEKLNFGPGANWSELSVGTNAIGTALASRSPIQVTGPEHFNDGHHRWTCAATPIFDPHRRIVACLDISGPRENANFPIMELVMAAAQLIEDRLHLELAHEDLLRSNKFMSAALESMDNSLITLDAHGTISSINTSASKLLGLSPQELVGSRISTTPLKDVVKLINGQPTASRRLASFQTKSGLHRCLVTSTPIKNDSWPFDGSVITLSEAPSALAPKIKPHGAETKYSFTDIVGDSPEIKEAVAQARMAAPNPSTILILGESGVGKEIFAQAIHQASQRNQGPFVSINCAALPKELIQSELFGYVEGAFTGARKGGRRGKLELAHGGTLFLDEIADMPLDLQANLLRVLEEKSFAPLGGDKTINVDLRVIAATHRPLEQEILTGRFREDLFYRINVVVLRIPSLRERGGDLALLVEHYLARLAQKMGRPVPKVEPALLEALAAYHWPGNVRELINVLEQAVNFMTGDILGPRHLPANLQSRPAAGRRDEVKGIVPLNVMEKNAIEHALNCCQGNISQVARALGIGRNTLYYKMNKYGIEARLRMGREKGLPT